MPVVTKSLAGAMCAGFLLVAGAASARAEGQDIGAVDKVQNSVLAEQDDRQRTLADGSPVYFQDLLRSGADARLQATLIDKTQITLGENAVLRIDEFVYEPGPRGGSLALEVVQGAFLFVGGEVEKPHGGAVSIDTPVGTLGIRGTTVWGGPLDGRYGVIVLDGEVTVSNAGGTVTLTKGMGTMVDGAATAPEAPAPWAEDRMGRAVATISFGR